MGRAGKERSIEPCPKILNYQKQYFLERPYIYTNHQKVISFLQLFSAYVPAFGLWMQFPWHRIEVSCGLRRPKKSTHTQRSKEGDTIRKARRENGSSGGVQVVSLRVPFSLAVCMPRKMREKGTLRSLSPPFNFPSSMQVCCPRAHQFLPCPPIFCQRAYFGCVFIYLQTPFLRPHTSPSFTGRHDREITRW